MLKVWSVSCPAFLGLYRVSIVFYTITLEKQNKAETENNNNNSNNINKYYPREKKKNNKRKKRYLTPKRVTTDEAKGPMQGAAQVKRKKNSKQGQKNT